MKGHNNVKFKLRAAVAGAATLAVAGGGLLAYSAPAFAGGTNPPYEPDVNAAPPYGNIIFYDANGNEVTGGTDLSSPFAYAVATTAADTRATKATLYFANPTHGENPSLWTSTSEAGPSTFSPASSLGAGTPADITADAPTYPVVAASSASVTNWLGVNTPDTTTGYANTIQVRIQDSGPGGAGNASGTYWAADIAYNTGTTAITVDGVSVGAGDWAQVFPIINSSTTTLSTSATAGRVTQSGTTPITLTASVSPTGTGTVEFLNGSTLLGTSPVISGTATYSYVPTDGSYSYTAEFIPTLGDETGANTTSASIVTDSTSTPAQSVVVGPPAVGTNVSVSTTEANPSFGQSVPLTAAVTEDDALTTGEAGSVQFYNNGVAFGSAVTAGTLSGSTTDYVLTTTALPQGTDDITAAFTPTAITTYSSSTTSGPTVVDVSKPQACSLTGSICADQQGLEVTVNPGAITISTPYTATNPFILPAMQLSSDGTYLETSAPFPGTSANQANNSASQQIVVTSTLAGDPGWTVAVQASNLSDGSSTINASGLGLTGGTLDNAPPATGPAPSGTYFGAVTFTSDPAHNPSAEDTDTNAGLAASSTFASAAPGGSDGTAYMSGTLTLLAPTSTPAGTYTGTVTFTIS